MTHTLAKHLQQRHQILLRDQTWYNPMVNKHLDDLRHHQHLLSLSVPVKVRDIPEFDSGACGCVVEENSFEDSVVRF
jgi:hypothetical protein